jgi:NADPH:quinone reductase-like Zn-dependent oxidoreductase
VPVRTCTLNGKGRVVERIRDRVVVAGAASGIGQAMSELFAAEEASFITGTELIIDGRLHAG